MDGLIPWLHVVSLVSPVISTGLNIYSETLRAIACVWEYSAGLQESFVQRKRGACIVWVLCCWYAQKRCFIVCSFSEKKIMLGSQSSNNSTLLFWIFGVHSWKCYFVMYCWYIVGLSKHLLIPIILIKTKTEQHVLGIVGHFKSTPSQKYKIETL